MANNFVYMFEHSSPGFVQWDFAKRIIDSVNLFDPVPQGSLVATVDRLQFELPSLSFTKQEQENLANLLSKLVSFEANSICRSIEIKKSNNKTAQEFAQEQKQLKHNESATLATTSAGEVKTFEYEQVENELKYDATDICIPNIQQQDKSAASSYIVTLKQLQSPNYKNFRATAMQKIAKSLKILPQAVDEGLL